MVFDLREHPNLLFFIIVCIVLSIFVQFVARPILEGRTLEYNSMDKVGVEIAPTLNNSSISLEEKILFIKINCIKAELNEDSCIRYIIKNHMDIIGRD